MSALEPIIAVFIDKEKSNLENIKLITAEFQEGLISWDTRNDLEQIAELFIPQIDESIYNELLSTEEPILYLVYDTSLEALNLKPNNLFDDEVLTHEKIDKVMKKAAAEML